MNEVDKKQLHCLNNNKLIVKEMVQVTEWLTEWEHHDVK